MKRIGYLYDKVCSMQNLKLAHKNARKGKGWYTEVCMVDKELEKYMKKRVHEINKHLKKNELITHNQWSSLNSYNGWLLYCNSYRLQQKYIIPLREHAEKFYKEVILHESSRNTRNSEAN